MIVREGKSGGLRSGGGAANSAETILCDTIIVYIKLQDAVFDSDGLEIDPFRGCRDHATKQNISATLLNFSSWSMCLSGHLLQPNYSID